MVVAVTGCVDDCKLVASGEKAVRDRRSGRRRRHPPGKMLDGPQVPASYLTLMSGSNSSAVPGPVPRKAPLCEWDRWCRTFWPWLLVRRPGASVKIGGVSEEWLLGLSIPQ